MSPEGTRALSPRHARYALGVLFTINLFNYIDRQIISGVLSLVQRDLAAGGESAESRSQLALYLAKSGQPADGVRELAAMPAGAARNATVLLRSAVVYELAGDRSRASRDLRAAIQAGASGTDIESEPDRAGVPR